MPHSRWPANPGTSPFRPSCRSTLFGNREHLALELRARRLTWGLPRVNIECSGYIAMVSSKMTRATGFPLRKTIRLALVLAAAASLAFAQAKPIPQLVKKGGKFTFKIGRAHV